MATAERPRIHKQYLSACVFLYMQNMYNSFNGIYSLASDLHTLAGFSTGGLAFVLFRPMNLNVFVSTHDGLTSIVINSKFSPMNTDHLPVFVRVVSTPEQHVATEIAINTRRAANSTTNKHSLEFILNFNAHGALVMSNMRLDNLNIGLVEQLSRNFDSILLNPQSPLIRSIVYYEVGLRKCTWPTR